MSGTFLALLTVCASSPCACVQVVVLSPDAAEPLASVDRGRVYVIGGIVDRTHIKGLTLQYAVSSTVKHSCGRNVGRKADGSDSYGSFGSLPAAAFVQPRC